MSTGPIEPWKNWSIVETGDPGDMPEVKRLFLDYARWFEATFDHTFCFQGFDAELAGLPGVYAPPSGAIWLARSTGGGADGGTAMGVIAVKPLAEPAVCEMKRLWVDPGCHGAGLGRHLAALSIAWARDRGYRVMKLDTLKRMTAAVALYRSLGFVDIEPYVANPIDDVLFLGLTL
jgi:ribosomal protein S18 acetylase RimI-like enzyme